MNEIVVAARGLAKEWPGGVRGVAAFDLEVRRGAVHALLGANGAGKTTALRVFAGLLRATAGRAEVLGVDPWGMPLEQRRRVGFLGARPGAYPWLTAGDAIDLVAGLHGEGFDRPAAVRLAARLELPEGRPAGELSLGMQRRLGLLMAIAPAPDLLILDEPAGGLDPLARREMLEIVLDLVRAREATVLYSTHILSDVERVASDVAFVARGRVLLSKGLDDLKESFRRARLVFDAAAAPPDAERLRREPGVVEAKVEEREALVTLDMDDPDAPASLAARVGAQVEGVFPLDLEEIYVAIGRREKEQAAREAAGEREEARR